MQSNKWKKSSDCRFLKKAGGKQRSPVLEKNFWFARSTHYPHWMRELNRFSAAPAAERECPAAEPAPSAPPASSSSTPQEDTPKKEMEDLPACRQCRWLEERLEQADRERREVAQENRQLWREISELRERIARLEERARHNAGE